MAQEFTARLDLTNVAAEPLVLWVEPWAHDFTLGPGESFTLIATSHVGVPYFAQRADSKTRDIVVYIEGAHDISFVALEGERELQCGHNRQLSHGGSLPNTSLERTRER